LLSLFLGPFKTFGCAGFYAVRTHVHQEAFMVSRRGLRAVLSLFLFLFFPFITVQVSHAQPNLPVLAPSGGMDLAHPYAEHIEVPVLVLDRGRAKQGLHAQDFTVMSASQPGFHPLRSRVEGDDPLTVGVLIDTSGAVPKPAMAEFREALTASLPGLLTGRDALVLYSTDCGKVRSADLHETHTTGGLRSALQLLLAASHVEQDTLDGNCSERRFLDGVAMVTSQLAKRAGRRVLLLLSNGIDQGSKNGWIRVQEYSAARSVAIFGVHWGGAPGTMAAVLHRSDGTSVLVENPMELLCRGTGGLLLEGAPGLLSQQVQEVMTMIRSRYILEFEEPAPAAPGRHYFSVAVDDRRAIVLASGVTVPVREAADPSGEATPSADHPRAPMGSSSSAWLGGH
jgi:hypothetical protein